MKAEFSWVGLDVGADEVHVCITDQAGRVLGDSLLEKCAERISTFVAETAPALEPRMALEACSAAIHVSRALRARGHCVQLFNTRQSSKFLRIRRNKTDLNDARGLADLVRLGNGVVSEILLKSADCQKLRTQLVVRHRLIVQRVATENAIKAALRLNGGKLKRAYSAKGLRRNLTEELLRLRIDTDVDLREEVEPLLEISETLRRHLGKIDRRLAKRAHDIEPCRRFLAIPGVGPITALSFYTAINDPLRFSSASDVGPYLGLVPTVAQSGSSIRRAGISKMGNRMTRMHLVNAAGAMMRQQAAECDLKDWGAAVTQRIGRPRAMTALARKIAVVMLTMWKQGEEFRPTSVATASTEGLGATPS